MPSFCKTLPSERRARNLISFLGSKHSMQLPELLSNVLKKAYRKHREFKAFINNKRNSLATLFILFVCISNTITEVLQQPCSQIFSCIHVLWRESSISTRAVNNTAWEENWKWEKNKENTKKKLPSRVCELDFLLHLQERWIIKTCTQNKTCKFSLTIHISCLLLRFTYKNQHVWENSFPQPTFSNNAENQELKRIE